MTMKPESIRLAENLEAAARVFGHDPASNIADTLRRQHALLVQAREWIALNGWHDDKCDVFCLDDDDRHLPCSCGLSAIADGLNAELEK